MRYFDLLEQQQYFDRFLQYNNYDYQVNIIDKGKETKYKDLICGYYGLGQDGSGNPSANVDVSRLINDDNHISNIWESLIEFGYYSHRKESERVTPCQFKRAIQKHKDVIVKLATYRMDCIPPDNIPPSLVDELKQLFNELEVVPEGKPKLVYVSKTLHFLLPDLVMPVDNAYVLRFLRKTMPSKGKQSQVQWEKDQFEFFNKEIFEKYVKLAHLLDLKRDKADGKYWNWSVPKRIDNAITGFWKIFNDDNMQHIICGNIDTLLDYLKVP